MRANVAIKEHVPLSTLYAYTKYKKSNYKIENPFNYQTCCKQESHTIGAAFVFRRDGEIDFYSMLPDGNKHCN